MRKALGTRLHFKVRRKRLLSSLYRAEAPALRGKCVAFVLKSSHGRRIVRWVEVPETKSPYFNYSFSSKNLVEGTDICSLRLATQFQFKHWFEFALDLSFVLCLSLVCTVHWIILCDEINQIRLSSRQVPPYKHYTKFVSAWGAVKLCLDYFYLHKYTLCN